MNKKRVEVIPYGYLEQSTIFYDINRYGYIYLLREKSQSLDFKVEVNNQLAKRIKSLRSNCRAEYYGRSDGLGEQHPRPFAKFLEEYSIIPQYTMPSSPTMNDVGERQSICLRTC